MSNDTSSSPTNTSTPTMPITSGPLLLERDSGLPAMRFEGGDVAVHLIDDPNKALLLHSDVLRTVSWFRAGIDSPWNKSYIALDPTTGKERTIHTYWMNTVEGTFWLEQGMPAFERNERGFLPEGAMFIHSGMSELDGKRFHVKDWRTARDLTVQNLRVLFAIIYDIEVTLADLVENTVTCVPSYYPRREYSKILPIRLADILAYAIWFDIEEKVTSKLTDMLLKDPEVWNLVQYDPIEWAELAKLLECKPLYVDSIRHCLSGGHFSLPWHHPSEVVHMSKEETEKVLSDHEQYAKEMESNLRKELQALALPEVDVLYAGSRNTWRTTVLNALRHRTRKVGKKQQRVEFAARSIWSQHVTQCFDEKGCYIVRRTGAKAGMSKPMVIPSLAQCMQAILEAPSSEDPCSIFGRNVVKEHVTMFGKDNLDEHSHQAKLVAIIQEAAAIVQKYETTDTSGNNAAGTANGGMIMDDKVTWALVPVGIMPWEHLNESNDGASDHHTGDNKAGEDAEGKEDAPKASLKVPTYKPHSTKAPVKPTGVSLKAACKEWLQTLGLYKDSGENGGEGWIK